MGCVQVLGIAHGDVGTRFRTVKEHGDGFDYFLNGIVFRFRVRPGLFTSPHLVDIRERIRLNGEPIVEDLYLRYFWEVWDKLAATKVTQTLNVLLLVL